MITPELISFIKKQIENNISKDSIISKLIDKGWHIEDIKEGFSSIESKSNFSIQPEAKIPEKEILISQPSKVESNKIWVPMNVPIAKDIKDHEFIPILNQKRSIDSYDSLKKSSLIKEETPVVKEDDKIKEETPIVKENYQMKDLSKIAMITSYKKDLMSVSIDKNKLAEPKKFHKNKWIIAILIIFVIAIIVWLFVGGYINTKIFNFSFIKKDPKILLLNNSKNLAILKSYKTETNIEIISPSFANISAGLISGELVSSEDQDSLTINTIGVINRNDNDLLSDNFVTIKSSFLKNYINTDIKNDGSDLFIYVPELGQILGKNAPESAVVKINKEQFGLIPFLFFEKAGEQLKKINFYNILSNGMSSYVNNDTLNLYDELINNADILDKGEETIKGIETYHYLINVDRIASKKLLTKIADDFSISLSSEDKGKIDEILGSLSINSFDVWIGKGDNNIYQYNVILVIPLSKIIGFDDKSIGNNQVKINWKTTYYDFNILSEILMPKDIIGIEDFIKKINKMKNENEVISFKNLASDLLKIEGSYGSKSNSSGDCMKPTSGSLFSPLGHSKKAVDAVSFISDLLNKIMLKTNNNGFCYSTPKAWSFTIPINDNYNIDSIPQPDDKSLFCIDSTGEAINIASSPLSVACGNNISTNIPIINN